MDRKTRKLMTIHGGLYPSPCVDRLYIQRSDGGRSLVSVEHFVEEEKWSTAMYATMDV